MPPRTLVEPSRLHSGRLVRAGSSPRVPRGAGSAAVVLVLSCPRVLLKPPARCVAKPGPRCIESRPRRLAPVGPSCHSSDAVAAAEDLLELERRRLGELVVATRLGLAIGAPAAERRP